MRIALFIQRSSGIVGDRRQIQEPGPEAVDRRSIGLVFCCILAPGAGRPLRLGDGIGARLLEQSGIFVIEQHWLEELAHMPLDVIRQHAQQYARARTIGVPVKLPFMADFCHRSAEISDQSSEISGVRQ